MNSELKPLPLLLNAAARTGVGASQFSREQVTPISIELKLVFHQSKNQVQITFLLFKMFTTGEHKYLTELLHRRKVTRNRSMRNSNGNSLEEPYVSRLEKKL